MDIRFVRHAVFGMVVLMIVSGCSRSAETGRQPSTTPRLVAEVGPTYRAWVATQADLLMSETSRLVQAIGVGDRAQAKELYVTARRPYERIEPVAESLGDLDPRIDAREGDVPADEWQGFHVLERVLWSDAALKSAMPVAQRLLMDVQILRAKIDTLEFTDAFLVAGSVELLNEVSTTKVTGEEERYSHTDLEDIVANVEGSSTIFRLLSPALRTLDPQLDQTIEQRFVALEKRLASPQVLGDLRSLTTDVDAVAEALSQVGRYLAVDE